MPLAERECIGGASVFCERAKRTGGAAERDGRRLPMSSTGGLDSEPMTSPTPAPPPLGHELVGSGSSHVIVLNDWLCDTSTWDGARPYLDSARFTFAFADVRGYGRSRG